MALFMMPLYMLYPLSMVTRDHTWVYLVAVPRVGVFRLLGPIVAVVRFRRGRLLTL